jgi:hypothetical protein
VSAIRPAHSRFEKNAHSFVFFSGAKEGGQPSCKALAGLGAPFLVLMMLPN